MRRTTKEDREKMRKLKSRGMSRRAISRETGFSRPCVDAVLDGRHTFSPDAVDSSVRPLKSLKRFTIEFEDGVFRIVLPDAILGTDGQTDDFSRLSSAINSARRKWL